MKRFSVLLLVVAACGSKPPPTCPPTLPVAPVVEAKPEASPPPVEEAAPTEPPLPPGVELSVTLDQNMEKGRAALAAKQYEAARAYFTYSMQRFPHSEKLHEAELALVDTDAAEFIALGRDDVDTVNSHCQFIAHHPFHPRVVSGDLACQVNKIQHTPCTKGDRIAVKYCGKPAYCTGSDKAEVAKRSECK